MSAVEIGELLGGCAAVCTAVCTAQAFIMRLMIEAALAKFMRQLDQTYVRTGLYGETKKEIERRLQSLEAAAAERQ